MNRINLICLGVRDMQRSLDFYRKLGFQTNEQSEKPPIVFFNNQGSKPELYPLDELAKDINAATPPPICGPEVFCGITLACNMKSKEEVDALFARVEKCGGRIAKQPESVFWGGYSGYFTDPDGYYWEVAYADDWHFDAQDMLIIEE